MTKMIARVLTIVSFIVFGFASHQALAQAAPQPGRGYDLSIRLFDGGRLVGTPQLTVRDGDTARMTVSGVGGYSMTIRVDGPSTNSRGNAASVTADVRLFVDGQWRHVASPVISVGESGFGTMTLAPNASNSQPFRMDLQVRARALTSAELGRIRPYPAQSL